MSELGPLDHISRHPLPWRSAHLTECGRDLSLIPPQRVLTREQVKKRIADVGQKRAAYSTCMTCATTSNRRTSYSRSDDGMVRAIGREIAAVEHAQPPRSVAESDCASTCICGDLAHHQRDDSRERWIWERHEQLDAELKAIAALVEAHREEFEEYLAGLRDTVKLADRRKPKNARRQYFGGAS